MKYFGKILLISVLLLSGCQEEYSVYEMSTPKPAAEETGSTAEPAEKRVTPSEPYNNAVQLDEEDIQDMNNGEALFAYSDEGYVTSLVGKYCEDKINDYEEAVSSLNGVANMIGLSAGSEFFCVYGEKDDDGYTYYTFQQRYGGLTLQYATLRIIIDPSGYTAGLSSSFTPNIGIAGKQDSITAEQAEEAVKNAFPDADLTFYSDATQELAMTFEGQTVNCLAVYTNNPAVSAEFDMMYLEHFVAYSGEYMLSLPTASLDTENTNAYKTDSYFRNLTAETYTGNVTMQDGTVQEITVPTAYNTNDGRYYLADVSRQIMTADYYAFNYENMKLDFISSDTNSGWQDGWLLAYSNYIKAYDFYAAKGIQSVDGFNTPILITMDMCDSEHNPIDNACYYGINAGWACFGVSSANHYSDSLDVVGHEFTHGVTRCSMQGSIYANETGAINESYSDIMGNLIEMSSHATSDSSWLVGETSGSAMRSMSDPSAGGQPEFVGDMYYVPEVASPDCYNNDNGGVHTNNSLASSVAYRLYESGMSLSDEFSLWLTSIELMTPYADYDDLYTSLIFSARINGLQEYEDTITEHFSDLGLLGDRSENARNATRDGYGRVSFAVSSSMAETVSLVYCLDTQTNSLLCWSAPDPGGNVNFMVPQGEYGVAFAYAGDSGNIIYFYQDNSWEQGNTYYPVTVTDGETIELSDLY